MISSIKFINKNILYFFTAILVGCGGGQDSTNSPSGSGPNYDRSINPTPIKNSKNINFVSTVSFRSDQLLSKAEINVRCNGENINGKTTINGQNITFTPDFPGFIANTTCIALINKTNTLDTKGRSFIGDPEITEFEIQDIPQCPNENDSLNLTKIGPINFRRACKNIYIESSSSKIYDQALAQYLSNAQIMMSLYFQPTISAPPKIIACKNPECYNYFAGGDRNLVILPGGTAGNYSPSEPTIVLTSISNPRNNGIISHESIHVEIFYRKNFPQRLPAWFDEGFATYASGEPPCNGISSVGVADLTSLNDQYDWNIYTSNPNRIYETYCQAAREVGTWIRARGNFAPAELIEYMRLGGNFQSYYGKMLTQ